MVFTTEVKIEALMKKTFDATTRPSSTEITTIITWSDEVVNSTHGNFNTVQKELLSTLMAAHLVESGEYTEIKAGDVTIKRPNRDSSWLRLYKMLASANRKVMFSIANN